MFHTHPLPTEGRVWGVGPYPENFGTFSLEMARVGANPVVF